MRDIFVHLKTSFINLCNNLNTWDTVDNARTKQNSIMDFIDNVTCTLQENIQNISDIIDDSLKEGLLVYKTFYFKKTWLNVFFFFLI